jgi:6-methylsalicylate decarboxylase
MALLNEHDAVIFLHPSALPAKLAPGVPAYVADFLLDTVRTAVSICKAGWFEKFPNVRFILSHAGGFIPFAAYRIARACAPDGNAALGMERLKRFYMDTAVASSPTSLPGLFAFADTSRITFGSDLPYANETRAGAFTSMLDAYPMDTKLRAAIARENALTLFPRLNRS